MLTLDDDRWANLKGGYGTLFDPRPLLARLEAGDSPAVWHELWEKLHHQGDVGDASYAAVPHLVRIHQTRGVPDWNTYALVAIIELARIGGKNPAMPECLGADYFQAIRNLAESGSTELFRTEDPDITRAVLSVIAIAKGLPTHGRFLVDYSEQELREMVSEWNG